MIQQQFDQIAEAIRALPNNDEKANLVQICANNFSVSHPDKFKPFRFVQRCYVKVIYDTILHQLELNAEKRLAK